MPMKVLRTILENLGCHDAATYIQSGNVVFRHASSDATSLEAAISSAVAESRGFEPRVLLFSVNEFTRCVKENPFGLAEAESKSLHIWFLTAPAEAPNIEKMNSLKAGSEEYAMTGNAFYLFAPDGIGRSKLAASVEKLLGVPATARNSRTASKICEMATKMVVD